MVRFEHLSLKWCFLILVLRGAGLVGLLAIADEELLRSTIDYYQLHREFQTMAVVGFD